MPKADDVVLVTLVAIAVIAIYSHPLSVVALLGALVRYRKAMSA